MTPKELGWEQRHNVDVTVNERKLIDLDMVLPFELQKVLTDNTEAEFIMVLHGGNGTITKRLSRRDVDQLKTEDPSTYRY